MPKTPIYNVNAVWDDPYDRPPERRSTTRFDARLKIKIGVHTREHKSPLVGSGIVRNISSESVYCTTKHDLKPGQKVLLLFHTTGCPEDSGISKKIMGSGRVARVDAGENRRFHVAIEFDRDLAENLEFAIFADYLHSISGIQSPS